MKKKNAKVKWHVYALGENYHALSDTDLAKMDDQQRAAYQPDKLGFDTDTQAVAYMRTIASKG